MTDKEKIANLLSTQPLYKKVKVDTEFYEHPIDIEDLTFTFFCPIENSLQTFKLLLEPEKFLRVQGSKLIAQQYKGNFDTFEQASMKYKFTQHYSATCQYCNQYKVHFVLQVETDKSIPVSSSQIDNKEKPMQIVKKIGQFPPFEITPDKDLVGFLNDEDKDNYRKALICRSQDYGIGAYAYLRRIVENEILRIVEYLAEIDRPESKNIKALVTTYKEKHVMTSLIEGVYAYLPSSLKNLGDNPLKVLYGQLSGGIHEFSEEKCSEKAEQIDTLLKFVVKKINEEKFEVLNVIDALKTLR